MASGGRLLGGGMNGPGLVYRASERLRHRRGAVTTPEIKRERDQRESGVGHTRLRPGRRRAHHHPQQRDGSRVDPGQQQQDQPARREAEDPGQEQPPEMREGIASLPRQILRDLQPLVRVRSQFGRGNLRARQSRRSPG